jgi:hypothetical protein
MTENSFTESIRYQRYTALTPLAEPGKPGTPSFRAQHDMCLETARSCPLNIELVYIGPDTHVWRTV